MAAPLAADRDAPAAPPTWRDLMPPKLPEPRLVTREELLAEFSQAGIDFPERTLRYWESIGVLPRPIRRWHGDAVHAVYPHWFAIIVATVAARREQGDKLPQIAAEIPDFFRLIATLHWSEENRIFPLPPKLTPDVEELARLVERIRGQRVTSAALVMYDEKNEFVSRFLYPRLGEPPTDSKPPE